jgi:hypothetical protein
MKVKFRNQVRELNPPRTLIDLLAQVLELFQLPLDSRLEMNYVNSDKFQVDVLTDGDFGLAMLEMGDRVCFNIQEIQQEVVEIAPKDSDLFLLMRAEDLSETGLIEAIDNLAKEPVSEFRKGLIKRCTGPEFNLTAQVVKMIGRIQIKPKEHSLTTPLQCQKAMTDYFAGRRLKADVMKEFEITSAKFDEWMQIFSKACQVSFSLQCYPEEFATEIMMDYLKGQFTAQQVASLFALPIDVLYSWIRQTSSNKSLQLPEPRSLDALLANSCLES